MATVHAVLFDFDGTLGHYRPTHLDLYVQAAAAHGIDVTVEALRAAVDAGWAPWETAYGVDHSAHSADEGSFAAIRAQLHIGRYLGAGARAPEAALQAAADELVVAEAAAEHFALYEDTVPALERVRAAGLRSYVVSNHIWRLPEVIEALGLWRADGSGLIAEVMTSARVGYRKPHPRIFEAAAAMTGEPVEALLYVGDNVAHDVEGARAVGMRAVLIDRDGKHEGLAGVDVVRSLMEVPL
jgi:putative hydrolase of the HAD superfamily